MGRYKKEDEDRGYEDRFINVSVLIYKRGDIVSTPKGYGTVLSDMELPVTADHLYQLTVEVNVEGYHNPQQIPYHLIKLKSENDENN